MDQNLAETRLGIFQKPGRINSIKLNHAFFHCTCLRVSFCAERLKIDATVTDFVGWLSLHLFYSSIWVVLSNRLNIAKFIPDKTNSLMTVKKVKGTARC